MSTWTKNFCGDPFFVHEFKKSCENFKKNVEYVNEILCPHLNSYTKIFWAKISAKFCEKNAIENLRKSTWFFRG